MPEGPEVKILVDNLNYLIKNKNLENIIFTGGRYKTHKKPDNYNSLIELLPTKIISINCKGKFIYILLQNNYSIWITLGMTGFFTNRKEKHSDITFIINKKELYFNDYRHFGTITICKTMECLNKKLKTLGSDIFSKEFTYNTFYNIIKKTKQSIIICLFIMNQKKISGVGNYLRSEIFYNSYLNPFLTLQNLSDEYIKKLYKSIVLIAKQSYNSQKKEMVNEKNYTDEFEFEVYQQKFTSKNEKVLKKTVNRRSIFYVEKQIK